MSEPENQFIPENYELIRELGSGQTSIVHLALHPRHGEIALKLPRAELQQRPILWRMFENEVQITLSLNGGTWRSDNVIKAVDGFPTGKAAFLTLEYCSGGTLDELMGNGALEFEEASRLILEVARGLEFTHKQQVLHRDVKPANVLLTDKRQAKLADFGTGMFMTEQTKDRVGTAFYMAPEIFEGKPPSIQGDIYSLGVLAYEVFSGERPFTGQSYDELMLQHLTSVPVNLKHKRSDVSSELSQVIAQAMSRDQSKRFSTVREFVDSFARIAEGKEEIITGRSARVSKTSPDPLTLTASETQPKTDKKKNEKRGFFSWFKGKK